MPGFFWVNALATGAEICILGRSSQQAQIVPAKRKGPVSFPTGPSNYSPNWTGSIT
jgi:hypothetical protein